MPTLPIDDQLDVDFVNRLARQEMYNKHLYRPNSYLHKWWARRCGTTFRTILKHLIRDDVKRDYYAPKGLEGTIILDPMMGGGTTLHEAIRLGANVIGADIDPIPVLQARATLSHTELPALEAAFESLHASLAQQLGDLFLTNCPTCCAEVPFRFVLYGQRRSCSCGDVVLIDSLTLRQFKDGTRITIDPESWKIVQGCEAQEGTGYAPNRPKLVERKHKSCALCGKKYRERRDLRWHARLEPYALFGKCAAHGEFFKPFDADDRARLQTANLDRDMLFDAAEFQISPAPKSRSLLSRNINSYLDLYSTRQLKILRAASALLREAEPIAQLNIGLLLSTALEYNSLLCGYKGWHRQRPGAIKQTFVRHAYSLPYTVLENNPLFGHNRSGTLQKLFYSRIVRGREWAVAPVERRDAAWRVLEELDGGQEVQRFEQLNGHGQQFLLRHGSSTELNLPSNSVDFVVTDPPYYDSVQYGDLARFFTVWLRQLLPTTVEWKYDLNNSAVNQHDNGKQYERTLAKIFCECRRVLKPEGRLIFTFHHWKPEAWSALTVALKSAEFKLINHYVVDSESPKSVHTANQRALLHDVVLVCGTTAPPDRPTQPPVFNVNDSYEFCDCCGVLLGQILRSSAEDNRIHQLWEVALSPSETAIAPQRPSRTTE